MENRLPDKQTEITKDDFINYQPIQVAAIVMRFHMMSHYGNLVYLDRVEWKNPDDHSKTEYIGHLCIAMQKKKDMGQGWSFVEPLKDAGTIVLDQKFQIKNTTSRRNLGRKLKAEYKKRGLK